jgi:hypothetical protein
VLEFLFAFDFEELLLFEDWKITVSCAWALNAMLNTIKAKKNFFIVLYFFIYKCRIYLLLNTKPKLYEV